ncbi:hypothetical protein HNQ80_000130 [Anaerosolibacter carboniphilus]|uniref:Uncharacterized protein n=1 Tax=Anaerosolibacter carboniphilus TaxID=1417629 RepID=A0A841KLF1_9FIRM|nr:hypothetical protein [Anaerosolibacter carboniphilus]MBB6214061.1 hypothetical protein [Anaerosolibacter carboniphilus]
MKVATVEQFKVLEFIKQNFEVEKVSLELLNRYSIKVTDKTGQSLVFKYSENTILWEQGGSL